MTKIIADKMPAGRLRRKQSRTQPDLRIDISGASGSIISMSKCYWEHYEHPADMGIAGYGTTKAEAFAQAAVALTAIISEPANIRGVQKIEVVCTGEDDETLLYNWLSRLVYEMAVKEMIFGSFDVQIENDRLRAIMYGEAMDPERHEMAVEVKAVTYMDLCVEQKSDGSWMARCVVDI